MVLTAGTPCGGQPVRLVSQQGALVVVAQAFKHMWYVRTTELCGVTCECNCRQAYKDWCQSKDCSNCTDPLIMQNAMKQQLESISHEQMHSKQTNPSVLLWPSNTCGILELQSCAVSHLNATVGKHVRTGVRAETAGHSKDP